MPDIIRTGDTGTGTCYSHNPPIAVTGTMITGEAGFVVTQDGTLLCTDGDTVQLSCGHTGVLVASGTTTAQGNPVGIEGDAWTNGTGVTDGTITTTAGGITEA